MNCIDVRRQLLGDPSNLDQHVQLHLQHCRDCARFAKGMNAFEQTLKSATNVPIPTGLASRVLLQQRMQSRQRHRWPWLAVAASLFLTIAAVSYFGMLSSSTSLETSVLSHIEQEIHHLQDRKNLTLAQVNAILEPQGMRLNALPQQVNYAGACQMRRAQGTHLVLDSQGGPVTVFLMPGEFTTERIELKNQRFQGVIVPIAHGSMAIVGEDAQHWRQLEQNLRQGLISSM